MDDQLKQSALDFHEFPVPGKIQVSPTKPLATQRDLALAYSPGVAAPCLEIEKDPLAAYKYTARGNLVAVISNGTAVLGLGNIGALAGKPVMEGKGVLFKKFAGIDVFDIEVDELDPDKFINVVAALEPTFGGINLEDIKAPECFYIEQKLRERMNIPVFHDDQHGTAIISTAAILNGLRVVEKNISDVRMVVSGAGAAAIACMNLLVALGMQKHNIVVCDSKGVIYKDREPNMAETKAAYAVVDDGKRTLDDVIDGADIFLGCSGPKVLTQEMVKKMARAPMILALANPEPEILPPLAKEVRSDAIICTGRSDYPNQVNNVLCFPFIFRGALDVGATTINDEMQLACIEGIAAMARTTTSAEAVAAYRGENLTFGRGYLIPKAFDPRLVATVATAVAKAAMETGVAMRPVDLDDYRRTLEGSVFKSAMVMRPVFEAAASASRRIVFAEGEDERVLHAANAMIEETTDRPILIGRPDVIATRCERAGLPVRPGKDFEVVNPQDDPRYRDYWGTYHNLMARQGISPDLARAIMRTNTTAIGAVMVHRAEADSLICGTFGQYSWHLQYVRQILARDGLHPVGALSMIILEDGPLFIADTQCHNDPTPQQVMETVMGAARHVRRFGLTPKIALCSHSQFGNTDSYSGRKMRDALALLDAREPDFMYDGEMHVDAALDPELRERIFPTSRLQGVANVLVFAGTDAASGVRNALKMRAGGLEVGPILMGMGNRAHIVTPSITTRGLLNMSVLAGTPVTHYG